MGIILAFIIFSVMIIIHELGHFLLARQHGITVTEFAVGMGPKLLSHKSKKSGTVYALKLVPFGGSCMMLGEDEDENSEGSFNTKSVWARMSVVLAGPIFNFFLAFIFAMIILANTGYQNTAVGSVEEGTPAAQAGLQAGDVITRIGNERVHLFKEISLYMYLNPNEPYDILTPGTARPWRPPSPHFGTNPQAATVSVLSVALTRRPISFSFLSMAFTR